MSSKWRYEEKVENRNYDQEARELIKPLSLSQQYELYGIAHKQTQRSCSDKRMKELVAVKKAIESSPMIDKYKLKAQGRHFISFSFVLFIFMSKVDTLLNVFNLCTINLNGKHIRANHIFKNPAYGIQSISRAMRI